MLRLIHRETTSRMFHLLCSSLSRLGGGFKIILGSLILLTQGLCRELSLFTSELNWYCSSRNQVAEEVPNFLGLLLQ